jgi:hypothetical protein
MERRAESGEGSTSVYVGRSNSHVLTLTRASSGCPPLGPLGPPSVPWRSSAKSAYSFRIRVYRLPELCHSDNPSIISRGSLTAWGDHMVLPLASRAEEVTPEMSSTLPPHTSFSHCTSRRLGGQSMSGALKLGTGGTWGADAKGEGKRHLVSLAFGFKVS